MPHLCVQPDAYGSHSSQNSAHPNLNPHAVSGRPLLERGRQRCQARSRFKERVVPFQPVSIHSLTQSQSYFFLTFLLGLLDLYRCPSQQPSGHPHVLAQAAQASDRSSYSYVAQPSSFTELPGPARHFAAASDV